MKDRAVKICGLKDPANILDVIRFKPDYIGLIFYPRSPRFIADPSGLSFLDKLPNRPATVGVFVNQDINEIQLISGKIKLDAIQLHGSETPEFCNEIRHQGFITIKAFGMHPGFDFDQTRSYLGKTDFFLFDTGSPILGGTGKQFDWTLLNTYHGETPFFLSGGLTPDTQEFPEHTKMIGVDLNSRFEKSPGIKDIGLLNRFLKHFRNE